MKHAIVDLMCQNNMLRNVDEITELLGKTENQSNHIMCSDIGITFLVYVVSVLLSTKMQLPFLCSFCIVLVCNIELF